MIWTCPMHHKFDSLICKNYIYVYNFLPNYKSRYILKKFANKGLNFQKTYKKPIRGSVCVFLFRPNLANLCLKIKWSLTDFYVRLFSKIDVFSTFDISSKPGCDPVLYTDLVKFLSDADPALDLISTMSLFDVATLLHLSPARHVSFWCGALYGSRLSANSYLCAPVRLLFLCLLPSDLLRSNLLASMVARYHFLGAIWAFKKITTKIHRMKVNFARRTQL